MRAEINTEELVNSLFRDDLQVEVPSPDVDLFESGILDSLKLAELLNCLEARLGAHISMDDFEFDNLRSIATIKQFLRDCTSQESG